jgi:cytochrome c oxidase subunit 3
MSHDAGGAHALSGGHWEFSIPPFVISFGILGLVMAFVFQFVYHSPLAAVISLGIGVPLIVIGVAGWVSEAMGHGEGISYAAMGWFILAEAMIFMSFFVSYWFMRLTAPAWPPAGTPPLPQVLPAIMTVVLVTSSVTIHRAEAFLHQGDVGAFKTWLILTILLGFAFLGMSGYEWNHLLHEGFNVGSNVYGTVFYSITGFHGSHVFIGICIFLAALLPAFRGVVNPGYVKTAGLYWHFVDIIWFFVVSQVYFW